MRGKEEKKGRGKEEKKTKLQKKRKNITETSLYSFDNLCNLSLYNWPKIRPFDAWFLSALGMYSAILPYHSDSANILLKIAKFDQKLPFFFSSPDPIFVQQLHYTYVMPRFEIKPCFEIKTRRLT